ncbi:MAG: PadR family transcriptional regulator [Halodesulfurarchaeum sp.]
MFDLTGFNRDLLTVIAGLDGPNGLEIKAELEDYYEGSINHGRLYPNLNSLVDQGYVEKSKRDERTNKYNLTKSGKRLLEKRREWEDTYFNFE